MTRRPVASRSRRRRAGPRSRRSRRPTGGHRARRRVRLRRPGRRRLGHGERGGRHVHHRDRSWPRERRRGVRNRPSPGAALRTTYFVVESTATTFKLARTSGGAAIDLTSAGLDVRVGRQQAAQAMFVNLTATTDAAQRLLAPSGESLASILPPTGDGISVATANGGRHGPRRVLVPEGGAHRLAGGQRDDRRAADRGRRRHRAARDLGLRGAGDRRHGAAAARSASASPRPRSISSATDKDATTTATIAGGASLTAGRDVVVIALNNHKLSASARALGGGILAGAQIAFTSAKVDNDVNVVIGGNVVMLARGAVAIAATRSDDGSTDSHGRRRRGRRRDPTTRSTAPSVARVHGARDHLQRGVTIGGGSQITGATVDIVAQVSRLDLLGSRPRRGRTPFPPAFADAVPERPRRSPTYQERRPARRSTLRGVDYIEGTPPAGPTRSSSSATSTCPAGCVQPAAALLGRFIDKVNVDKGLVIVGGRTDAPGTAVTVTVATGTFTVSYHTFRDGDQVVPRGTGRLAASPPTLRTTSSARPPRASPRQYGGTPVTVTRRARASPCSLTGSRRRGGCRPRSRAARQRAHRHRGTPSHEKSCICYDSDLGGRRARRGHPVGRRRDRPRWARRQPAARHRRRRHGARGERGQVVNSAGTAVTPVVGQQIQRDAANGITVAAIANSGYADIKFHADSTVRNEAFTGSGSPPWPVFEFRDTLAEVVIVDYFELCAEDQRIDVVNAAQLQQRGDRAHRVPQRGLLRQPDHDARVRPQGTAAPSLSPSRSAAPTRSR